MAAPISYLALKDGTPVLAADGAAVGTVLHVLQDDDLDFFDGIVVRTHEGARFLDADRISEITDEAVRTTLSGDEAAHLPAPDGPAVLEDDPQAFQGAGITRRFGRMFLREHWMRETGDDPGRR